MVNVLGPSMRPRLEADNGLEGHWSASWGEWLDSAGEAAPPVPGGHGSSLLAARRVNGVVVSDDAPIRAPNAGYGAASDGVGCVVLCAVRVAARRIRI
jgi:hypothetical protein